MLLSDTEGLVVVVQAFAEASYHVRCPGRRYETHSTPSVFGRVSNTPPGASSVSLICECDLPSYHSRRKGVASCAVTVTSTLTTATTKNIRLDSPPLQNVLAHPDHVFISGVVFLGFYTYSVCVVLFRYFSRRKKAQCETQTRCSIPANVPGLWWQLPQC